MSTPTTPPRKINQIAVVVKNVDRAIKFYQETLGIGPFQVLERPQESCELHGKPTTFRLKTAMAMVEGTQLELIQVLEGCTAHSEFLAQRGEGLHHLGYFVTDLESEIAKCTAAGVGIISRGEAFGMRWAYMDTEAVSGAIHEFIELPKPRPRKKKEEKPEKT
jgi:catechol 2,3-dioxygenase-like lactoylglutathione lyase family enzyme